MKALAYGLIIIAVANLLAIGGFVGWLVKTDRLDMDRVRDLRSRLAVTITQQKADEAEAARKVAEAQAAAAAAAKAAKPPLTASEQLAARLEATELDKERLARLRREVESLQKRIADQTDQLARDRATLENDRKAFTEMTAKSLDTIGAEQFAKTLNVLSTLKPAAAKSVLTQMLAGATPDLSAGPQASAPSANGVPASGSAAAPASSANPAPEQVRKVVQYLDAMEDRVRTKVMNEFAKDDPAMASRLLSELRDKGKLPSSSPQPARTASAAGPG
jgi:chromosome segregation ATPase